MNTDSMNREVGEIKAQVRYLTQDVHEIKSDVKLLLADKWKRNGMAIIVSGFISFIVAIVAEIARAR